MIELRFAHANDPSVDDLALKSERFLAEYPSHDSIMQGTVGVKVSPGGLEPLQPKSIARGFRYYSKARDKAIAMTIGSMAYSRLAGYENRHGFVPEAMAALDYYLGCIPDSGRESRVTRIGVRFINTIALPAVDDEPIDLNEIFVGLPQAVLDDPIERLDVDLEMRSLSTDEHSRVRLRGPVADQVDGTVRAIVLDIDAWKDLDVPVRDEDVLLRVLSGLFDLRSRLFYGSLHDSTLARYE